MALEWNDTLAVGVAEIDRQHKELIRRINVLVEAARVGKGKEEIGRVLEFLALYVVDHFATEEQMMVKAGYPQLAAHRLEHTNFIADFTALKEQFQRDGATTTCLLQTQKRVVDWLLNHIARVDKALGAFLS